MIIHKLIEVGLDIQNTMDFYSDPDNKLMYMLKSKYEGIIYCECLILSVVKVLRRSTCSINKFGRSCFGKISVEFEVKGFIVSRGDLLIAKVRMNDNSKSIICSHDLVNLHMDLNDLNKHVKVDQFVPVMIMASNYIISKKKISGIGEICYHFVDMKPIIITSRPTVIENSQYKMEIDKVSTISENPYYDVIKKHLSYNYKTNLPNTVTMDKFYASLDKYKYPIRISRPKEINLIEPIVVVEEINDDNTFTYSNNEAIVKLQYNYFTCLQFLREMVEVYGNEKTYTSHKNLWIACDKTK